jgi:hypothetical protein
MSAFYMCISNYSRGTMSFVCLELISVCVDILSFLWLIRDVAKLCSSGSYGQITRKVCNKYMDAFHLCIRKHSRGSMYLCVFVFVTRLSWCCYSLSSVHF